MMHPLLLVVVVILLVDVRRHVSVNIDHRQLQKIVDERIRQFEIDLRRGNSEQEHREDTPRKKRSAQSKRLANPKLALGSPNTQITTVDLEEYGDGLALVGHDGSVRKWSYFAHDRFRYFVGLTSRSIVLRRIDVVDGTIRVLDIEAESKKNIVDVVVAPVSQDDRSRLCLVALFRGQDKPWLHLYCQDGINGEFVLEEVLDEEIGVTKITATTLNLQSYFSVITAGSGISQTRIYKTERSVDKIRMIFHSNLLAPNPTNQQIFSVDRQLHLAIACNISKNAVKIFKMDSKIDEFELVQQLSTSYATSVHFFNIGSKYFLAVASSGRLQTIYRYRDGRFYTYQTIEISNGQRWHSIKVAGTEERILLLVFQVPDMCNHVLSFVWNHRQQKFVQDPNSEGCLQKSKYQISDHVTTERFHRGHGRLKDLERAKSECDGRGSRCFGIMAKQVDDRLEYFLVGSDAKVSTGRDTIYEKISNRGFSCHYGYEIFPRPDGIASYVKDGVSYVIVTDNESNSKILKVSFRVEEIAPRTLDRLEEEKGAVESLERSVEELRKRIQNMTESGRNTKVIIDGQDGTLVVDGDVIVSSGLDFETIVAGGRKVVTDPRRAEEKLSDIRRKLERVGDKLSESVRIDQQIELIGSNHFKHLRVEGQARISSVNAGHINGHIDVTELTSSVVQLDQPTTIQGTVTIDGLVTANGDVMTRLLNGIPIDEYLTTNTEQRINVLTKFSGNVTINGNIKVKGKVNDIDFAREVVTTTTDQNCNIKGTLTIEGNVYAEDDVTVEGTLNGVDLMDFNDKALKMDNISTVTGKKTIVNDVTVDGSLSSRLINGINMAEFQENVVRTDRPVVSTGHWVFDETVRVNDRLVVGGQIDNVDTKDLLLKNKKNVVTGTKTFSGTLNVDNIVVNGYLNGWRIPDDVMTLSTDQRISGSFVFDAGFRSSSTDNIRVGGLTAGSNFSEINQSIVDLRADLNNTEILDEIKVTGKIGSGSTFKGRKWSELMDDVVFRNDTDVEFVGAKTFLKEMRVDNELTLIRVNGYHIQRDFLLRNASNQRVRGLKVFKSTVEFNNVNVKGLVDGVDVAKLSNEIVRASEAQTIRGEKTFIGEVRFYDDVNCENLVNGLKIPDDIVMKDQNQLVKSNKIFSGGLTVERLNVKSLDIEGGVNDINNLTDFFQRRMTLSTDQRISGKLTLKTVYIDGDVKSKTVNRVNLSQLVENLIYPDVQQDIYASKRFKGFVKIEGNLKTSYGINEQNITELDKQTILLRDGEVNLDNLALARKLIIDEGLNITGSLNKVDDVQRFAKDVITADADRQQTIQGTVIVHGNLEVDNNINGCRFINGVNVNEIFQLNRNQNITGNFTFTEEVKISGNVKIGGSLTTNGNDVDLQHLNSNVWKKDDDVVLEGTIHFKDSISTDSLNVSDTINGVNLRNLAQDAVYFDDDGYKITGHKILTGSCQFADILATNVNGENFLDFQNDVRFVDRIEELKDVRFVGEVEFQSGVQINADVIVKGLIGGHNFTSMVGKALYLDKNARFYGEVRFLGDVDVLDDVFVTGKLNEINLSSEVVTKKGSHRISGSKKFNSIVCNTDLNAKLVNGLDLKYLREDTLMRTGNQVVRNHRAIQGHLSSNNLIVGGLINNLKFSSDLVTLTGDQDIQSSMTFTNKVHFSGNVTTTGSIDGVTLEDLYAKALELQRNETLSGSFDFQGDVRFTDDLLIDGTLDVNHLADYQKSIKVIETDIQKEISGAYVNVTEACTSIGGFYDIMKGSTYFFQQFVKVQELETSSAKNQLSVYVSGHYHIVEATSSVECIRAAVYTWDEHTSRFIITDYLINGITRKWATFEKDGVMYLASADSGKNCEGTSGSVIYKYDASRHHFYEYSKTNIYAQDVTVLSRSDDDHVYLLYAILDSSAMIMAFSSDTGSVEPITTLPGGEVSIVESFSVNAVEFFVLGYSAKTIHSKTVIYQLLPNHRVNKIQEISIPAADIVHFNRDEYHYLIIADRTKQRAVKTSTPTNIPVYVYTELHETPFTLYQELTIRSCNDLEIFTVGYSQDIYLAAVSENFKVEIFEFAGASSFRPYNKISSQGAESVSLFYISSQLYMSVSKIGKVSELYKALMSGATVPDQTIRC